MRHSAQPRAPVRLMLVAAAVLVSAPLAASEIAKGISPSDPKLETVELFAGIDSGKIEARVVPRDSTSCRVWLTNKTDKPLNVLLPEAMAATPVSAQLDGFSLPNRNRSRYSEQSPQGLGLGVPGLFGQQGWGRQQNTQPFFNPLGPGLNFPTGVGPNWPASGRPNRWPNQGPNRPIFSIPAEKTGQLRLASVCLDYGHPDPKPTIPYELRPMETVAKGAEVQEICRMLGRGELTQHVAQAAAWHLSNDLSWTQLARKRAPGPTGLGRPLFTRRDLVDAQRAVEKATVATQDRQQADRRSLSASR